MEEKSKVKTVKATVVRLDSPVKQGNVEKGVKKCPLLKDRRVIIKPEEPVYTLPVMPPDYDKKVKAPPVVK